MERLIHTADGELKLDIPFYYRAGQRVRVTRRDTASHRYLMEGDIGYITEETIKRTKEEVGNTGKNGVPKYIRVRVEGHREYGDTNLWVNLTVVEPVDG